MRLRWLFLGLVTVTLPTMAIIALHHDVVRAQEEPEVGPLPVLTTRYAVSILKITMPPGGPGGMMGEWPGGLVRGVVSRLGDRLMVVPKVDDLLTHFRDLGRAECIFLGEMETSDGKKGSIVYGERYPVETVDVRGDQTISTTKFEKCGVKVELSPAFRSAPDQLGYRLEFSDPAAWAASGQPVIVEFSSAGELTLPDGCMALFTYLTRVDGSMLSHGGVGAEAEDLPVRYIVQIVREDLRRVHTGK